MKLLSPQPMAEVRCRSAIAASIQRQRERALAGNANAPGDAADHAGCYLLQCEKEALLARGVPAEVVEQVYGAVRPRQMLLPELRRKLAADQRLRRNDASVFEAGR